jgi:hypothetical protein
MRALWDRYPELPYRAVVPWPVVELNGNLDWIASVDLVETWLEHRIGRHRVEWTWNMWTLHNYDLCSVAFAREADSTLFLLRWDNLRG